MSSVAFLVVVFPAGEIYLKDFLSSVAAQTHLDFDLIIANDGLQGLSSYLSAYPRLKVRTIDVQYSTARNRQAAFEYIASQGYRSVVLGDVDDLYAPDRVACSLDFLEQYDIVVNDFDLIGPKGELLQKDYLSKRVNEGHRILPPFIRKSNMMGFANSALKVDLLRGIAINDDLITVDWYVFATLLEKGCSAVFTKKTKTLHRMYAANLAAINASDEQSILNGLRAKLAHYRAMVKQYAFYKADLDSMEALMQSFSTQKDFGQKYMNAVKKMDLANPFWYEEIQILEGVKK